MKVEQIIDIVNNNPVIAAVSGMDDTQKAIESPCEVVFLLSGTIMSMKSVVDLVHSAGKLIFIHVDLMKGLACDMEGLSYMKAVIQPDGIISTKANVIRRAKELGFVTVQRLFVLDSKAIEMGSKQLKVMKPDFVEIMPGALVKIIERFSSKVDISVIAGGLIDEEKEVMKLLKAGAVSISTTCKDLWAL